MLFTRAAAVLSRAQAVPASQTPSWAATCRSLSTSLTAEDFIAKIVDKPNESLVRRIVVSDGPTSPGIPPTVAPSESKGSDKAKEFRSSRLVVNNSPTVARIPPALALSETKTRDNPKESLIRTLTANDSPTVPELLPTTALPELNDSDEPKESLINGLTAPGIPPTAAPPESKASDEPKEFACGRLAVNNGSAAPGIAPTAAPPESKSSDEPKESAFGRLAVNNDPAASGIPPAAAPPELGASDKPKEPFINSLTAPGIPPTAAPPALGAGDEPKEPPLIRRVKVYERPTAPGMPPTVASPESKARAPGEQDVHDEDSEHRNTIKYYFKSDFRSTRHDTPTSTTERKGPMASGFCRPLQLIHEKPREDLRSSLMTNSSDQQNEPATPRSRSRSRPRSGLISYHFSDSLPFYADEYTKFATNSAHNGTKYLANAKPSPWFRRVSPPSTAPYFSEPMKILDGTSKNDLSGRSSRACLVILHGIPPWTTGQTIVKSVNWAVNPGIDPGRARQVFTVELAARPRSAMGSDGLVAAVMFRDPDAARRLYDLALAQEFKVDGAVPVVSLVQSTVMPQLFWYLITNNSTASSTSHGSVESARGRELDQSARPSDLFGPRVAARIDPRPENDGFQASPTQREEVGVSAFGRT